ncbi:MAG: patatin-like phospholipase family protein [Rubrivivax sp.]|nr:patatin-like phospholipase family protein [Rubrivivax sp.]
MPIVALMKGHGASGCSGRCTATRQARGLPHPLLHGLHEPHALVDRRASRIAGPSWLWARSSTSVPGIGPPVIADGELLVDGGVMDNLPVGPLQEAGASVLIACDVTSAAPMLPAMADSPWI